MSSRLRRVAGRFAGALPLTAGTLATVVLFLFAVQLLGTAADAAAPAIERVLRRVVVGDLPALGFGWLAAYALANGSVVAAVALSLFDAGVLPAGQLFATVAGSRLGASAVVVLVGGLDHLQRVRWGRHSLRSSVSMGTLAFLLTHSVFLPATALGYVGLRAFGAPLVAAAPDVGVRPFGLFEPATAAVTTRLGPAASFVLAVGLLFGSLRLFDRLLARVETGALREQLFARFERPWVSFGLGLVLTGATTSVAFSLGVVVPLYNRGYVERDELVPYVLGANVGTFADTLVVAVVLESPVGFAVVSLLVAVAAALTLAAMVALDPYGRAVAAADDRLLDDRRAFAAFVAALVAVPLALLLVPLVVG